MNLPFMAAACFRVINLSCTFVNNYFYIILHYLTTGVFQTSMVSFLFKDLDSRF